MFELAMWRGGEAITRGDVIDVCADAAARKSIGIPDKYRQVIQAWEEAPS
jgi:acyl-CoA thioesterase FadM